MKFCPISYEPIEENTLYHQKGLNILSPKLTTLSPLPFTASQLRQEAMNRASKLSIQGVQAKLSARLHVRENRFELVDTSGTFILKPASDTWPELPANEALTMTLAKHFGLNVPLHGLLFDQEGAPVYFIKRFDRYGKNKKYAVEDFAQLTHKTRETKYNSTLEKVSKVIDQYATFPKEQHIDLLRRILFCFCTGNEDMHLKNFSLIQRDDTIYLSPVYDFLNTTIALVNPMEEMALPLNGKKNKLLFADFFDYFARDYLKISPRVIERITQEIPRIQVLCEYYLPRSYLSQHMKERYQNLVHERISKFLGIKNLTT